MQSPDTHHHSVPEKPKPEKPKRGPRSFVSVHPRLSVAVAAAFVLMFSVLEYRLLSGTHAASALISANSKSNCIYVGDATNGASLSSLSATEQTTGVKFNCLEASNSNVPGWTDWDTPWMDKAQAGLVPWVAASPSTRQLVIAQDLIPGPLEDRGNPLSWEQACGAGQYNSYSTTLARNLVTSGFGNSVIRLGFEMNGTWEVDSMGTTAQEMAAWKQCYVQEVNAMKAVAGANFLFDWNPNSCYINEPFAQYYPGDPYVDIIGLDQYDAFCTDNSPTAASPATFQQLEAEPGGLDAALAFAKQHGKPMSLPQWGIQFTSSGGFGDDPYYTSGMGAFVQNNNVAFQSYFDAGGNGALKLGPVYPLTLQAYKAAFASPAPKQ